MDPAVAGDFAHAIAGTLPALARLLNRDAAVLRLADTSACAVAAEALADVPGAAEGTIARIRRHQAAGGGPATIWATGERASVEYGALRNSVAQRYLDYNDTYVGRAVTHPSDLIPALVAMAEARDLGWDRLLESVTVGYEVLCRLADQAQLGSHGFDGSTLTPIATVAGAAWLAGLDTMRAAEAISIAALDAGTLRSVRQGKLSDWKAIASGRGAAKALFAIQMVEAGCRGPERVFEGKDGFCERVSGPLVIDASGDARLPTTLVKKYPTQIFIQGLIELAEELRPQLDGRGVKAITIALARAPVEMLGGASVGHATLNRETADHSPGFAIAAVLLTGRLSHSDYDALLSDPRVLALNQATTLTEDAEATRHYPREFAASVSLTLEGGATLSATHRRPRPMDSKTFVAKLDDLWPSGRPREWPWRLGGEAPKFPA